MHGGTVEARSAGPGQGSEFIVRLPVVKLCAGGGIAVEPPATAPPRRILVVDDNRTRRSRWPCSSGWAATRRTPPTTAWQAAKLPSGNPARGRVAGHRPAEAEWLRGVPSHPGAAVGSSDGPDRPHGLGAGRGQARSHEAGFDGHLVKPVSQAALMKLLTDLCRKGDSGSPKCLKKISLGFPLTC